MNTSRRFFSLAVGAVVGLAWLAPVQAQTKAAGTYPVIVLETAKGPIEFEVYPDDAPKSVAHILALVKRNFYTGLRFHRVEKAFVIQWGDPMTRDMTKRDRWGTGGSGQPIGVAEISKTRKHRRGAVGMAHAGDPTQADSQIYIVLSNRPAAALDGKYAVVGQVVAGLDLLDKIEVGDVIKRVTVREAGAKP